MENLIKPVDYAAKMGISRQAVYAKIKKGVLASKNVGGKIYIVLDEESFDKEAGEQNSSEAAEGVQKLLEAKEETIAVLKETIRDLKETNQMITSTLRSEVELLKEAFGEMKTLYAAQIEHIRKGEEPIPLAEIAESETKPALSESLKESNPTTVVPKTEEERFITLEDFLEEQGIRKKKLRKRLTELAEQRYKKGDKKIRKEKKEIAFTSERAAKLLEKAMKKGK